MTKNDPTSDKAQAKTVSFPASFWKQIEDKVGNNKGARSQYLQDLVRADLAQETTLPKATDRDAIIKLTQVFAPTAQRCLNQWLCESTIDQPHLIAQVLNMLADNISLCQRIEAVARENNRTIPEILKESLLKQLEHSDSMEPFEKFV